MHQVIYLFASSHTNTHALFTHWHAIMTLNDCFPQKQAHYNEFFNDNNNNKNLKRYFVCLDDDPTNTDKQKAGKIQIFSSDA